MPAIGPDRWGDFGTDADRAQRRSLRVGGRSPRGQRHPDGRRRPSTVGGRYVFHHMTYESVVAGRSASTAAPSAGGGSWPIHEVGRNADIFPPEAGRLLAANSSLALSAGHLHSNGRETKAHLEFGFKFFPKGYKPIYKRSTLRLGNGIDIDVQAERRGTRNCTPTRRCRSTPRSSRSSRTSTRRASACASKRSGATTSRRSTASATTTTG